MKAKKVLAIDLGASSGRVILGAFDGKTIRLHEIHRFANDPVSLRGTLYWDVLRLWHEIKQGLLKAKGEGDVSGVGVDTWGVDFGLLDAKGRLLENPVHYRDARTAGMLEKGFARVEKERFYGITGNQFMELNTAFQLLSLTEKEPQTLERAESMLLMPDLFNYFLSGERRAEYSIASTTQLLDARQKRWSTELIDALGLPRRLFAPIAPSGTRLGPLTGEIRDELGLPALDVTAVTGHDTQCAMAATPSPSDDFIFLSCGTWSLLGTELDEPVIGVKSRRYNVTNEGGYGGRTSFLKNIIGLWLVQESRRQWQREGRDHSFADLEAMASEARPLRCFIDPDAPEFVPVGDIPGRIADFCRRTRQPEPETMGEVVRCIDESLALKYRFALEQIEDCTGKGYDVIHVVGGGAQSELLCRFTANACRREVRAGPVEATVLGNVVQQLIAAGDIGGIAEARRIIAESQPTTNFEPCDTELWDEAYERFKRVLPAMEGVGGC